MQPETQKAVLLDDNDRPLTPSAARLHPSASLAGGQSADQKTSQSGPVSGNSRAGDGDHWLLSTRRVAKITREISARCGHLSGSPDEWAHLVEATKMAVASACDLWVEQQVLGLIDRSTRLLPDLFADLMVAAKATVGIDKAGGLMVALAREQVDLPEVMFDWILRTTIDDGLEALEEQRSSERWAAARTIEAAKAAAKTDHRSTKQARREQLGQVVAAGNVIESIERLASRPVRIPEMAKLLEKLDEVVDRGQEINVTVNVDEDRLGEAIARAMKPRADVEVLAMNATGKPSLMRRSDGTVRRLEYDPDGAIIAMRQVEDVEAELAFLSAGKGSEKAAGVEELREWARSPQLGDVSESARRVLRSKRLTW